jgi:hypothetical protein
MKHSIYLIFILIFFSKSEIFSQSHSKNTLSFDLNFDGGAHATFSEQYYNNVLIDQDTSGAVTTMFRFDAHYNILKPLSVGLFFRSGKYIEDAENTEATGNKVTDFSIGLRGYMVNKEKFALYAGLYFGTGNLEINRIYFSTIPFRYLWKGGNYSFDLGFNWYFAKIAGLNFSLGYSGHKFDLKEYYINGTLQDLSNSSHTFDTQGAHINLGVVFRFLGE